MNRLKELRKLNNLTLKMTAKEFNISPESYRKYENEEREPSFFLLIQFADFFNVSLDYLLGRTDKRYTAEKEISDNELKLLSSFNSLSPSMQDYTLEMIEKLKKTQN